MSGLPQASTSREMAKRINYFNTLTQRAKLDQLARCRFMNRSEFANGVEKLAGKKIVIVGCGAQGLNQGLNMRDSGCDVSYALRQVAIDEKRASYVNSNGNGCRCHDDDWVSEREKWRWQPAKCILGLSGCRRGSSVCRLLGC